MSTVNKLSGVVLAASAAALFAGCTNMGGGGGAMMKKSEMAMVKCMGANSCKGQSECATASNSCKGQNSCAGKGWISTESEEACTSAGGTVES